MIQIKPIKIGLTKTATQLTVQIMPYPLFATTGQTYWQLYDADGNSIDTGNTFINEIYWAKYGTDDTLPLTLVLTELGLEKAD